MKILLIRHGETDWNKKLKIQGITDIPLNETGMKNSAILGSKLNIFKINAAYSSCLSRAYDTGRIMLDNSVHKNLEIIKDSRIKERSFGSLEGYSFEKYREARKNNFGQDVENEDKVYSRVKNFFFECYQKHKDETIVVISHGGCIRLFLQSENLIPDRKTIDNDEKFIKYRHIHNNSIHELEYDGKIFSLLNFDL